MEKIMILDTETTNSIEEPLCYDIGFIIADREGHIYEEGSFVVADIFLDKELMSSAFFAEKIPTYWEDIKNGSRKLRKLRTIKFIIYNIMKKYHINKVYAFNVRFDFLSTKLTQTFCTCSKYKNFFPKNVQFYDILAMAKTFFKNDSAYKNYCIENGYVYGKNNQCRYTAEIVYRYITKTNFEEVHCGLEDCKIEYEIFLKCLEKVNDLDFRFPKKAL